MAIKAKDFVKAISNSITGAKEGIREIGEAVKSHKKAGELKERLIIEKAQKEYSNKYGERMSPSTLKGELEGGPLSDKSKEYLAIKKEVRKKLNK